MNKKHMNVPDNLYKRPTVIVQPDSATLPEGVLRGRKYTEYKLLQLVEALGKKHDDMTRADLLELVKLAGSKQQVEVTCKSGSVYTHIQPASIGSRFTGWNGTAFGTFHPSNVKSFRILGTWDIPANEQHDNDSVEFYYF